MTTFSSTDTVICVTLDITLVAHHAQLAQLTTSACPVSTTHYRVQLAQRVRLEVAERTVMKTVWPVHKVNFAQDTVRLDRMLTTSLSLDLDIMPHISPNSNISFLAHQVTKVLVRQQPLKSLVVASCVQPVPLAALAQALLLEL